MHFEAWIHILSCTFSKDSFISRRPTYNSWNTRLENIRIDIKSSLFQEMEAPLKPHFVTEVVGEGQLHKRVSFWASVVNGFCDNQPSVLQKHMIYKWVSVWQH